MFLTRWQPMLEREFNRLQREMNRVFEEYGWGGNAPPALSFAYPALNLWVDEENVFAEAELPGMTQDQVQVFVTEGNQLTIEGERKPVEVPQGVWHRQERGFGKFNRVITLPVPVDANRVEARLEHGILHLRLPKSAEAKPRRIPVTSE
jgi:HSP20 family protein